MEELRRATIDDAEALSALATATFHDGWAEIVGETAAQEYAAHYLTPERLRSELADPDAHGYVVATQNTVLIGYAKLDLLRPAHGGVTGTLPVLLQRLYVAARKRGTGTADALLTTIEADAARHGFDTLWLECDPRNARAWRFYEGRGFAVREQVSYHLPGGQNDQVRVLERPIASATRETVRSTTMPPPRAEG